MLVGVAQLPKAVGVTGFAHGRERDGELSGLARWGEGQGVAFLARVELVGVIRAEVGEGKGVCPRPCAAVFEPELVGEALSTSGCAACFVTGEAGVEGHGNLSVGQAFNLAVGLNGCMGK